MAQATRLGPGGYPIAAAAAGPVTTGQSISISPTLAVSVVKGAAKIELITTSSAVNLLKGGAKKLTISATGTVSFLKGVAKKIAVTAASVVSAIGQNVGAGTNHAQLVGVSAASAVSFTKGLGKFVGALCTSVVNLVIASTAKPVIGDVSVVWSQSATAAAEWTPAAQVTVAMSQTLELEP